MPDDVTQFSRATVNARSRVLQVYDENDGSLHHAIPMPLSIDVAAALGNRVVALRLLNDACNTPEVDVFDSQGQQLAAIPFPSDTCSFKPSVYAVTATSAGAFVAAGSFSAPYDFGAGTFFPRGVDGFVVALSP
jgi:hypothetical protein